MATPSPFISRGILKAGGKDLVAEEVHCTFGLIL